jgi:hypothetical protein
LVERLHGMQEVWSSTLHGSTKKPPVLGPGAFCLVQENAVSSRSFDGLRLTPWKLDLICLRLGDRGQAACPDEGFECRGCRIPWVDRTRHGAHVPFVLAPDEYYRNFFPIPAPWQAPGGSLQIVKITLGLLRIPGFQSVLKDGFQIGFRMPR